MRMSRFCCTPDFSLATCSFEKDLCGWIQGAAEDLEWQRWNGSSEFPSTSPSGDHTSGNGKSTHFQYHYQLSHHMRVHFVLISLRVLTGYYMYITSSIHNKTEARAQLKSSLSPPSGPDGYCFSFWYHMFGANVGSLRMSIYDTSSNYVTLVRQNYTILCHILFPLSVHPYIRHNNTRLIMFFSSMSELVDVAKAGVSGK